MSEVKSLPRTVPVVIHAGVTEADVKAGEAKYAERTVKVRKLPLGQAASLGVAFKSLINKASDFREHDGLKGLLSQDSDIMDLPLHELALQLVGVLPELMEVAADGVIEILSVGSGVEPEELREVGFDEASELFLAIVTVNNLEAVQRNLKNALGRLGLRKRTPTPETA
jgi:hypothetical protein